jgi:hypothetical protein
MDDRKIVGGSATVHKKIVLDRVTTQLGAFGKK